MDYTEQEIERAVREVLKMRRQPNDSEEQYYWTKKAVETAFSAVPRIPEGYLMVREEDYLAARDGGKSDG